VDVFDFRHVAVFRNQSASHATRVKIRGKISHSLALEKIRGKLAKCLSEFYEFSVGSNFLCTFDGVPLGRMEECQEEKDHQRTIKVFRQRRAALMNKK